MKNKQYYIYILTSKKNGTLYTGITSNLIKRVYEHKNKLVDSFTKRYEVDKLVYYEVFTDVKEAILREKRIKKWKRQYKLNLINSFNKEWKDLYFDLF
ncbi:MAG: GIY-YIG nuclease family protein [Candidatus Muiribacteriota bacterium]